MRLLEGLKTVYLALIALFLYLPIAVLILLSFNESKSMFKWTGFSLKWYREMFTDEQILSAIFNTFVIALSAAGAATVIGTLACFGIMGMKRKSRSILLGVNNIPLLNADIVMGISLMLSFIAFGMYMSRGTVIMAHITFDIPFVILAVMPKLRQMGMSKYEAALDLGATPLYAARRVVMPDIWPGIVTGFLLAFTMSVDDFVVTHFTRGAGINTISTLIYSQVRVGIRPTLFALSAVLFIMVLVILLAVNLSGRGRGEKAKEV